MKKEMLKKLPWDEFRSSGLLWFINNILHLFGRAIYFDYTKQGKLKKVFYVRCKFRGFSENIATKEFFNLTTFLKKNIKELEKDIKFK